MLKFPCLKCGLCCRMLRHVPELKGYDRGDGVCRYLEENLCAIYENRPLICNIGKMYEKYFSDVMSEDDFIKINFDACRKIYDMYGNSHK